MPRKPVRSKKRTSNAISEDQEFELVVGPGGRRSVFFNEEERRKAWERYKKQTDMSEWGAGERIWAWWKYDAPEPRRVARRWKLSEPLPKFVHHEGYEFENYARHIDSGYFVTGEESITYESTIEYLKRLNLLNDWEIQELKRKG